ncbi:hypothetical protein EYF80_010630 [Liparis tanakae]|uniref:Uncharacterized protein n=1 Tax=Liparis tanakae TaxID=230148 RepID=A0A4Z2IPP4_9TELE|nr:hypothetical protein EYF80_010630 [Liparis tanakae]
MPTDVRGSVGLDASREGRKGRDGGAERKRRVSLNSCDAECSRVDGRRDGVNSNSLVLDTTLHPHCNSQFKVQA